MRQHNNKVEEVLISKIKPDPNQPRKYFDPEAIASLAKNISVEGVINPIEIDEHFVIITGESRFRAARQLGHKTIRAITLTGLNEQDKFKRQLFENIHNDTMSIEDTANALKKYHKLFWKKSWVDNDTGLAWLGREFGKTKMWVDDKLAWFRQSKFIQNAILKGKLPASYMRIYFHTLEGEVRKQFERKLVSGNILSRDVGRMIPGVLKAYPEYAQTILNTDFSQIKGEEQGRALLATIIPGLTLTPLSDHLEKKLEPVEELTHALTKLNSLLKSKTWSDIPNYQKYRVALNLQQTINELTAWFKEVKQLEDAN